MKSENQIIPRREQPIKIEKPLQCLLSFSYSVVSRNILQTVLSFFYFSYFLSALLSNNNNNDAVTVLGHYSQLILTLA